MEDIITIVIVLIFFVIPLFRKIFEAAAGNAPAQQRKQAAIKDLRKYLNQMQGDSRTQPGYKAPATRPANKKQDAKAAQIAEKEKERPEHSKLSLKSKSEGELVSHGPSDRNYFKEIIANPNFSDAQKAVIMSEIFKRPKLLI